MRQRVVVRPETRRPIDQELWVRLPGAAVALYRAAWRVIGARPPSSRVRRAAVRALCRRGCEVLNRRDFEVAWVFVHPEIESVNTPRVVELGGLSPGSHGREAWVEGQRRWLEDWEEFRYDGQEVVDLGGDRFLLLGRVKATGRGSGVLVDSEWGLLYTVADGLLAHERNFLDHAEALEAAGLPA